MKEKAKQNLQTASLTVQTSSNGFENAAPKFALITTGFVNHFMKDNALTRFRRVWKKLNSLSSLHKVVEQQRIGCDAISTRQCYRR